MLLDKAHLALELEHGDTEHSFMQNSQPAWLCGKAQLRLLLVSLINLQGGYEPQDTMCASL